MEVLSYKPDVVILDLGLPDMDGVSIIEKIRSWSSIPIIVVSARTEDQDKVEALDAGADDYLTKPFSIDEFLARLRAAPRRSHAERTKTEEENSVYINGDLKIDFTAGCVYMNDAEIHLTPSLNTNCCACWRITLARCLRTIISFKKFGEYIGVRCSVSAGVHGDASQKGRKEPFGSEIYSDSYRRRVSNDPAIVKKIFCFLQTEDFLCTCFYFLNGFLTSNTKTLRAYSQEIC